MYHLLISNAAASAEGIAAFITPWLPLIGILASGLIIGIFGVHNRRQGNMETRAPDVNEAWAQQARDQVLLDAERRLRRKMEDHIGRLWSAFVGYVRRVQNGGSTELTTREQKVIDMGTDIEVTQPSPGVKLKD